MTETSCGQLMSHRTVRSESLGSVNRPEQDYWRRGESTRLMSSVVLPARKQRFWNIDTAQSAAVLTCLVVKSADF
jgi:hypothetical protein